MIGKRVCSALFIAPLVFVAAWFGGPFYSIVVAVAAMLGALEFYGLLGFPHKHPLTQFGLLCILFFVILAHFEGIYTASYGYGSIATLNSNHDKIEDNMDVGIVLEGTDENSLIEHTKIKNNAYGIWQGNWYGVFGEVITNFKDCDLRKNLVVDVVQDPWAGDVTLNFEKVKYIFFI